MTRRSRRVVPAVLAGLVLLVLGAWLVTVSVGHLLGQDPTATLRPLADRLQASTWQDPGVVGAGVVLVVLGLVAVLAAALPGPRVVLALQAVDGGRAVDGISRSGLRRVARHAAEEVDGVGSADASVDAGRVVVRVRSALHDQADLRRRVEGAVQERLAAVPLVRPPRVEVRTSATRSDA